MRGFIAVGLLMALAGCATPPGQLKHEDLSWAQYSINAPLPKVYEGLQTNARHCGGLIDQYDPKWYPSQDMRSAKIDLYLEGGFGGTSDWVAGIIELESSGSQTLAKVGIQNVYSNPVFRKRDWWRPKFAAIVNEIVSGATPSCE